MRNAVRNLSSWLDGYTVPDMNPGINLIPAISIYGILLTVIAASFCGAERLSHGVSATITLLRLDVRVVSRFLAEGTVLILSGVAGTLLYRLRVLPLAFEPLIRLSCLSFISVSALLKLPVALAILAALCTCLAFSAIVTLLTWKRHEIETLLHFVLSLVIGALGTYLIRGPLRDPADTGQGVTISLPSLTLSEGLIICAACAFLVALPCLRALTYGGVEGSHLRYESAAGVIRADRRVFAYEARTAAFMIVAAIALIHVTFLNSRVSPESGNGALLYSIVVTTLAEGSLTAACLYAIILSLYRQVYACAAPPNSHGDLVYLPIILAWAVQLSVIKALFLRSRRRIAK